MVDDQLVLLLSGLGFARQWTRALLFNQLNQDLSWQDLELQCLVLIKTAAACSDRQMAERVLAFQEDEAYL